MIEIEHLETPRGVIVVWRCPDDGALLYLEGKGVQSLASADGESMLDYVQAICGMIVARRCRSILLLGCGGGTLATMLFRRGIPSTVVDINPASFAIARKHFALPPDLRCVTADALAFLAEPGPAYDCIVVDAYDGAVIPDHLVTDELGRLCRGRLADRGVVIANVTTAHPWDDLPERFAGLLGGATLPTRILDTRSAAADNVIVVAGRLDADGSGLVGESSRLRTALARYRVRRGRRVAPPAAAAQAAAARAAKGAGDDRQRELYAELAACLQA